MNIVASASFQLGQGTELAYQGDKKHPLGTTPFNIERTEYLGTGIQAIYFSVPTERPGLARFRWYLQGPNWYDHLNMEWIDPGKIIVTGDVDGTLIDTPFSLMAIQELPNGQATLPPEFILYATFDAAGALIESDPDHPLGAFPSRGVSGNAQVVGAGAYRVNLNVDFWRSSYSWFVWYEAPPGFAPMFSTHQNTFPYGARQTQVVFTNNIGDGNIHGKWHMAAYKHSEDPLDSINWYNLQEVAVGVAAGVALIAYPVYLSSGPPNRFARGSVAQPFNSFYFDGTPEGIEVVIDDTNVLTQSGNTVVGVAPGTTNVTLNWQGKTTGPLLFTVT